MPFFGNKIRLNIWLKEDEIFRKKLVRTFSELLWGQQYSILTHIDSSCVVVKFGD
jgi:hypothetical protein